MLVMKFGGTSVESAVAIKRIASIVGARAARQPIVVVSAMGKTTNKLLAAASSAVRGARDESAALLDQIEKHHLETAAELQLDSSIAPVIQEHIRELRELANGLAVLGELTPRSVDAVSAYGERLSSRIVAAAFNALGLPTTHVDSRKVIVTDNRHTQAVPLYQDTYDRLAAEIPRLAEQGVVVMGGFIASTLDGVTTTLGRGGSDFTASIVGAGVNAEEIQIWTDVDGMLTCDPTILEGGHRVRNISFSEAAELAYFGAKVLHPATVLPAIERNIPVRILNSRRPEVEGTRIDAEPVVSTNVVKSIACKRNITVISIASTRMLMAHGFLRRIFEVFDRHETPVDMVSTSEVSVSLTIDNPTRIDAICREVREFAQVDIDGGQAIVCLVGENIRHTPGVAARVFCSLRDVNVRMISQGASLLNLSLVVAEEDLRNVVEALHAEFFRELDPQVFEV